MSPIKGYTQGAVSTFGHDWAEKVCGTVADVTADDGVTVRCRVWLPLGASYAASARDVDVSFQRRRRLYRPLSQSVGAATHEVVLDLDYDTGVLTVSAADGVTASEENGMTVEVIA